MQVSNKTSILQTFVLTFLLFILLLFLTSANDSKQRIDFLNHKIEELGEIKRGFESKAVYHEEQAQRLQFVEGQLLWAQKHARAAERYSQAADKVQEEIDRLERERAEIRD